MLRITLTCLLLGLSSAAMAEMRLFTSADGSKSLTAELIDYDEPRQTITLRLQGGRQMTTPITAFCEEDQTYAKASAERMAAGRKLAVRFEGEEGTSSEAKTSTRRITTTQQGFNVEIRNNGELGITGLSAEYKIFVSRDGAKKSIEVQEGNLDFAALEPRKEEVYATEMVGIKRDRPLPPSECKKPGG